ETHEYSRPDGNPLTLDIYRPEVSFGELPVVVFVHGGGWKNGDKTVVRKKATWLTEHGFAVASIDFRQTDVAGWPAQIDDCYAAVRWLRENGEQLGLATKSIAAAGTSSGGHLVALMGTRPYSGDETASSRVQAVVDWFGPADLLTMPPNNVGNGRTAEDVANSNGAKLLRATVLEVPERAKDASALYQASADDAAFLILHGDADEGVPVDQSQRLHAALVEAGAESQLIIYPGAGHGGKAFEAEESRASVVAFLNQNLR
ncbi:alpha/beta hydrolase, partial [Opitutaceae bacterium]|nr:alpha/beta hydrolase [Opitutaceae bacterium]